MRQDLGALATPKPVKPWQLNWRQLLIDMGTVEPNPPLSWWVWTERLWLSLCPLPTNSPCLCSGKEGEKAIYNLFVNELLKIK